MACLPDLALAMLDYLIRYLFEGFTENSDGVRQQMQVICLLF